MGDAGAIVAVGDGGVILRSTDHGATWALIASGTTADLHAIWGAGARDLWTVGGGGAILHSTDAGIHWRELGGAQVTGDLTGVWASGASDVVVSADAGQVICTHDGGRSFQVVRPLGETDELFTGIWGSAADDLYVVGDRGSVLASADGGRNWEVRQKQTPRLLARGPDPPKGANSIGGSRIYGVTGLARGELLLALITWVRTRKLNDSGAGLMRVLDSGRSWKPVRIAPPQSRYAAYRAFFTRGDGVIYGVTDFDLGAPAQAPRAGLIVSTDGGATFKQRSLFDVEAGSVKALWRDPAGPLVAVGWGGTVLRSLDDGRTWTDLRVHALGRAVWRAIWTDGLREVWIAGWKCAALHSADGGAHFEAKAPSCLRANWVAGEVCCWAPSARDWSPPRLLAWLG